MKQKPHHERRKAAGIEAFAAQKGVTRSIQTYKHRKESKFAKKASLLREYHKVMKKEGLEAGRGKRKRDHMENDDNTERVETQQNERDENHEAVDDDEEKDSSKKQVRKRKPKMNPLTKVLQKASERKAEQEQERVRRQQELADQKIRMAQRKRNAKILRQRTKKGQPVMKNIIAGLLSSIEHKK